MKLKHDELLSISAVKFHLRRYKNVGELETWEQRKAAVALQNAAAADLAARLKLAAVSVGRCCFTPA